MKKIVMKLLACLCISTLSLGSVSVMAATDVEIENPTPDLEAPILKSIEVSSQELTPTKGVKISAEVEDELSGVEEVRITYKKPNNTTTSLRLILNVSTGKYEGTLSASQNDIAGTWAVSYITLTDKKENSRMVTHTSGTPTSENQFNFSECAVNVSGVTVNTDREAPVVRDIMVNNSKATVGNKIQLVAEVTDNDTGVSTVRATYKKPSGKTQDISLTLNTSTGKYEGNYTVGQYDELGIWKLDSIYVQDRVSNSTTIKNYVDSSGKTVTLQHCDVEVVDTTPDSLAPVLKGISVKENTVTPTQKIEVTAIAEDDLSGISSLSVTYRKPRGGTQNISLRATTTPGEYTGSYTVGQYDEFGTWILESVYLQDRNLNSVTVRSYTDVNGETHSLENGDIEVIKTTPDYEAPIIQHLTIWPEQVSSQQVNVKLEATAIDYLSDVNSVSLVYKKPSGRTFTVSMVKTTEGKFLGTIPIDKYDELGTWTLQTATTRDARGNSKTYNYINEANDFQNYDINVYGKITIAPSVPMSITVDPYQAQMTAGQKKQLIATLNYSHGETEVITANILTKYASSNNALVTVSAQGQMACVGTQAGNAIVEASYGRINSKVRITVNEGTVEPYLNISPLSTVLSAGQEQQIKVEEMIGTIGTDITRAQDITYTSLSPNIATVTSTGLIQIPMGVSTGKAIIQVNYKELVGTIQVEVTKPSVKSLIISPIEETIKYGESIQLAVKALMSDGTVKEVTSGEDKATFKSSNTDLATVNEDGLVTALPTAKSGVVKITATYNNQRVVSTITINGIPEVVGISIEPGDVEVEIGGTQQLVVTGLLTDGTTKDLTVDTGTTYRTSSVAVATVDAEGNVTVKETAKEGAKATITATYNGLTAISNLTVIDSSVKLTGIEVVESSLEIEQGKSHQVTVNAVYSDGSKEEVTASMLGTTYRTSSVAIATVDTEGLVTVKETATVGGRATITVSHGGFSQPVSIVVKEASVKLTGIEVDESTLLMEAGQVHDLSVTALYSDGTTEDVTSEDLTSYCSNNEAVATVDGRGKVTLGASAAVGEKATITVSYKGYTAKVNVTVDGVVTTGIEVAEPSVELEAGRIHEIVTQLVYSDGTKEFVEAGEATYRTSSVAVATVDANGQVTVKEAAMPGATVKITVSYAGHSTVVEIKVVEPSVKLESIQLSEETILLEPGESSDVTVTAVYSDGTTEDVTTDGATFRIGNVAVATVDTNGEITVKETATVGQQTTLTVTYKDLTAKATVQVDGKVLTGIETSEAEVKVNQGESYDVTIYAVYDDGSREDVTTNGTSYRASNTNASVDENGRVSVGENAVIGTKTTITATYKGYSAKVVVIADGITIVSIEAAEPSVEVEQGKTHEIKLNAVKSDGSTEAIAPEQATYRSSSVALATVDSTGKVTVKETAAIGSVCTITATYNGLTTKIEVVVLEASYKVVGLDLGVETISLEAGETYDLSVYAVYNDGSRVDVTTEGTTYRTGNTAIATIDATGRITVKPTATVGQKTTITVVSKGITEKATLEVTGVVIERIDLPEASATVGRGQTYQVNVEATYSDGTQKDVTTGGATYRTGNSAIATVDSSGLVTVKETATIGVKTTLTVTYNGVTTKMTITVGA